MMILAFSSKHFCVSTASDDCLHVCSLGLFRDHISMADKKQSLNHFISANIILACTLQYAIVDFQLHQHLLKVQWDIHDGFDWHQESSWFSCGPLPQSWLKSSTCRVCPTGPLTLPPSHSTMRACDPVKWTATSLLDNYKWHTCSPLSCPSER